MVVLSITCSGTKSLPRSRFSFALLLSAGVLAGVNCLAQATLPAKDASPTAVQAVRVVPDKEGPSLEILANRPIIPTIQKLENPPRLVIDLPNTNFSLRRKRFAVSSEQVSAVRLDQFQKEPPVTRVVVDLLAPITYSWDTAGNRLMVRLRPTNPPEAQPPTVTAFSKSAEPAVVPVSTGGAGNVVLAGNRLAAGSSVTAGADTAILHLARGGEVRVCPGSTVSVTPSQSGRDLMLAMNTGSLETNYSLDTSADSVLTPDFRILLAGPGEFHYAISVDRRGNTCVRTLPGNTSSAIVSELMGDGTYQVKPGEQVVFRSGRLAARDNEIPVDCGCPVPERKVLRAAAPPVPPMPEEKLPQSFRLAERGDDVKPLPPPSTWTSSPSSSTAAEETKSAQQLPGQVTVSITPETAPLPPPKKNEVQVQIDAPFVFRATDPPPAAAPSAQTAPVLEAKTLPLRSEQDSAKAPVVDLPPAQPPILAQAKTPRRGFFGKLKGFFGAIFR